MTEDRLSIAMLTAAALVATASAMAASLVLSTLAKPEAFEPRVAKVAGTVDRARTLSRAPGDADAYSPRALCPSPDPANLDAIRSSLASAASQAGLSPASVSLTTAAGGDETEVVAIKLGVQVEGPYDGAMRFLAQLDRLQPQLFIDTVDLRSKLASVDLRLSGKMYCWPATH